MGKAGVVVFTVHGTKTFLDRQKGRDVGTPAASSTLFGNWYATLLGWRPDVALFVNEVTFLPVLVPVAPAKSLLSRFPEAAAEVMAAIGIDPGVIGAEVVEMELVVLAKTGDRQKVGVMVEQAFIASRFVEQGEDRNDLTGLAVGIAGLLVGPLYKPKDGPGNPAEATRQHIAQHSGGL